VSGDAAGALASTFRLGRWKRVSRFADRRIAEGEIIFFGCLSVRCVLHHRDGQHSLSFPKGVVMLDHNRGHYLARAVVSKLKAKQSNAYWGGLCRRRDWADRARGQGGQRPRRPDRLV
jgi:hypothetical protein